MAKRGSILDYRKDKLDPEIWRPGDKLKDGIKRFISFSITGFFEDNGISGYKEFLHSIFIGSSLATYFYSEDSDLDIKIVIDLEKFISLNPDYTATPQDEVLDKLTDMGRDSLWLSAIIPGTLHVLDSYFYSTDEFYPANLLKYDSLYSVLDDTWVKEPKQVMGGYSPGYILELAKQKAKPYIDKITLDIARAQRDTIDFLVLKDYIKGLDSEDLISLFGEFKRIVNGINDSVEALLTDRELAKELRKDAFSKKELTSQMEKIMGSLNYSDGNLIFKILQRYGYMRVLSEIYQVFKGKKVTSKSVEELVEILNG